MKEDEQAHGDALAAFERLAYGLSSTVEQDRDIVRRHLTASGVPDDWQQPAWRPIDTYPKDQGVYRNGTRCWLWHETLGVVWGFMDDLPSGFRCELNRKIDGEWVRVAYGVKAAKGLHYWMPKAPEIPESPRSTS